MRQDFTPVDWMSVTPMVLLSLVYFAMLSSGQAIGSRARSPSMLRRYCVFRVGGLAPRQCLPNRACIVGAAVRSRIVLSSASRSALGFICERTVRLVIKLARRRRCPSRGQKKQADGCDERAGYEAGRRADHEPDHCQDRVPWARSAPSARSQVCLRPQGSAKVAGTFPDRTKHTTRDIPTK